MPFLKVKDHATRMPETFPSVPASSHMVRLFSTLVLGRVKSLLVSLDFSPTEQGLDLAGGNTFVVL